MHIIYVILQSCDNDKSDHWQSEPSLSSASPSSYHPVPVNCACAPDQACSLGTDWEQHDQLVNNFNIILGLNPNLYTPSPGVALSLPYNTLIWPVCM